MRVSEMTDAEKMIYTLETIKRQRDALLSAAKQLGEKAVWDLGTENFIVPRSAFEPLRVAIEAVESKEQAA